MENSFVATNLRDVMSLEYIMFTTAAHQTFPIKRN